MHLYNIIICLLDAFGQRKNLTRCLFLTMVHMELYMPVQTKVIWGMSLGGHFKAMISSAAWRSHKNFSLTM